MSTRKMLAYIEVSITDECDLKVVTSGESYEIYFLNGDLPEMVQDGPTFLRILISRVTINSRSTVSNI